MSIVICLVLLIAANGMPVLLAKILKSRWVMPVDGGHHFFDGKPWFGASKTWRGILIAILAPAVLAQLLNIDWQWGAAVGALAMLGDLLASFIKRRIGIAVSGRAWLLDQIPESALPILVLHEPLGLSTYSEVTIVVAIFTIMDLTLSPLLYQLHIRKRPY